MSLYCNNFANDFQVQLPVELSVTDRWSLRDPTHPSCWTYCHDEAIDTRGRSRNLVKTLLERGRPDEIVTEKNMDTF